MKNELVVKDNALINASYNLDTTEQRLILLAIVQARELSKHVDANSTLEVHAHHYMKQFNVDKHAAYEGLKNAASNLFERKFSYKGIHEGTQQEKIVKSRWVSKIAYVDSVGIVELTFAPDVIPLITQLEKSFTAYELKQISSLTSKYAIRLYELLIQWRSVGKTPLFELDDFRFKLGLAEGDYTKMANFKVRVLDAALNQINELTDIIASYEQHKNGRVISGFSFTFTTKHQPKEITHKAKKLTEKQIQFFANKLAHHDPFASKKAAVGESYADLEKRLLIELQDVEFVRKYAGVLKELGLDV
ncbi:replication initiation protein [Acinetobacter ursingii]|uniref:replication initiation protein RepM n=1 Tax=Acinetobacter TaxID=469 RepID=UPI00094AC050|nr:MULTISPECIES: replication initiation protein RepM [Acinetobacter]PPZ95516.1 replication initiation protein [Acinetobacter ursingii]